MVSWLKRLRLGTVLGLIVAGYLAFSLLQIVRRNHELRQKISGLEQNIVQLEEERAQLQYRIRYYQTDAFKEKEARAKLGLQAEGENVIVLPKQPVQEEEIDVSGDDQPRKSNFEQWWEFLFG